MRREQELDELLEIKRSACVTLNDVCLGGVVAGALRLLAAERGEAPQPLKIMVPVSYADRRRGD